MSFIFVQPETPLDYEKDSDEPDTSRTGSDSESVDSGSGLDGICMQYLDPTDGSGGASRFVYLESVISSGSEPVKLYQHPDPTASSSGPSIARSIHSVVCDQCYTSIHLTEKSLYALNTHRNALKCRKTRQRVIQVVEEQRAQRELSGWTESIGKCGSLVDADLVRSHIGMHILRAVVGFVEEGLLEQVHPDAACGLCGRVGCETGLERTKSKSYQVVSKCPRYHKFNYFPALKFSCRMPSTNVPLLCTLCGPDILTKKPPVLWKYSAFHHIRTQHPAHWDPTTHTPRNLDEYMDSVLIMSDEEHAALIPDSTIPPSGLPPLVSLPYRGHPSTSSYPTASIRLQGVKRKAAPEKKITKRRKT